MKDSYKNGTTIVSQQLYLKQNYNDEQQRQKETINYKTMKATSVYNNIPKSK